MLPVLVLGAILVSFVSSRLLFARSKTSIPVVGSRLLGGYITAFRTAGGALRQLLAEGYEMHSQTAFSVPDLRNWVVYVSSQQLIQDVRKAPDDVLSFQAQVNELLAIPYTMGPSIATDPWHNAVAHKVLTSNIGPLVPDIWDEIYQAFADNIGPLADGEWRGHNAHDLLLEVICRATNRMFVGLPLCRDKVYTKISIDYTITVMIASYVISAFPPFLKPFVSRYVSGAPKAVKGFERFLIPVIEERLRKERELGKNWEDKPNDFLQWTIDAAPPAQKTSKELTLRMMVMNFAAIHTSSSMFTSVLYNLALHPQYVAELREEADHVQDRHQSRWSKEAVAELFKADSFIKETMRCQGIMLASLERRVLKPFQLSDGTVLPVGVDIAANQWGIYHDPTIYPNPETFDPWRFSRKVEAGGNAMKESITSASADWLTWGHGAHICAGRYFAAQEFKLMLACLVLNYDMRLERDEMPKETVMGNTVIPNSSAKVLFRRHTAV